MNFDNNTVAQNDVPANNFVQVTADTRSTLRALSATFTKSLTVISELLQNGRRAGATRIDVIVTDDVVVVQDNGSGLDDFGILLKIAESGWNEQVRETENPYGIGFVSSCFSCKYLGVMSKGKHLYASTDDLIDLKQVVVNESVDLGVTEIRLHEYNFGKREAVEKHLRDVVKGFPIPVYLNGEELERPDALANVDAVEAPFGHVTKGALNGQAVRAYYLQGLPIKVASEFGTDRWTTFYDWKKKVVVHLDSTKFHGRMPDRDSLRDPEQASALIDQGLKSLAIEHLTQLSETMDEVSFVTQYGSLAKHFDMQDVLNRMSVFPADWVERYTDLPKQCPSGGDRYLGRLEQAVVSRNEVLTRGLVEIDDPDYDGALRASHALYRADVLVSDSIPSWHWASNLVEEVSAEDFELVPGEVRGEESVDIFGYGVTLVLVTSLNVRYVGNDSLALKNGSEFSIPTYFDVVKDRLYVLESTDPGDAAWQVTNFEVDESYDEGADSDAYTAVSATMDMLMNPDAAALLKTFISKGLGSANPKAFKGKSFTIAFDENGVAKVSEVA